MSFVFGKSVDFTCIQTLDTPGPHGETLCLAYRTESYGLVFPGYTHDAGYAIGVKGGRSYWPLDDASIARKQQRGVLPDPLPGYSVPFSKYAWGFSLWPFIAITIIVALLRRRAAIRRHVAESAPPAQLDAAIEVTASHNVLLFMLFLTGPTITLDGYEHPRSWGTWSFPVKSGMHKVEVAYRWFNMRRRQSMEISVEPGETKCIGYHRGFFFSKIFLFEATPTARVERSG